MIRFIKEENGERVTEMNIKKLSAFLGIAATLCVSLFGWGYSLTREVTINTSKNEDLGKHFIAVERRIDKQLTEIRSETSHLRNQNSDISKQLTELLHKQDVRISLLEQNLVHIQEK